MKTVEGESASSAAEFDDEVRAKKAWQSPRLITPEINVTAKPFFMNDVVTAFTTVGPS
jgi:hypothetical protein